MDRDQYDRINNSYKKTLVFHLGLDAGFFSEYCNMLYAISYCLLHRVRFTVYCKDANFGKERGWQDYFQPFFPEVFDDFHHTMNYRFSEEKITTSLRHFFGSIKKSLLNRDFSSYRPYYLLHDSKTVKSIKKKYHFDYFTQDIWNDFNHYMKSNEKVICPFTNAEISSLSFYNLLDSAIWKYNNTVREELNIRLDPFQEDKFVGIHIRRGDKITEAKYSALESYMDCVKEHSSLKRVFVATDDYTTYKDLCAQYPDYDFFTFARPENSGYQQGAFNRLDGVTRYNNTLDLFADIEMLTKADSFIGTFTSNVGQFMIIHRNGNNCYMIDYDFHTL